MVEVKAGTIESVTFVRDGGSQNWEGVGNSFLSFTGGSMNPGTHCIIYHLLPYGYCNKVGIDEMKNENIINIPILP